MASTLNGKRMLLMMLASFGLLAAVLCAILLLAGVREPTRERLFLVGSIFIVSLVCLVLSFRFKDDAIALQDALDQAQGQRDATAQRAQDEAILPQNAPAADAMPDLDEVSLPQNAVDAK